jgi:hypothetical protein
MLRAHCYVVLYGVKGSSLQVNGKNKIFSTLSFLSAELRR